MADTDAAQIADVRALAARVAAEIGRVDATVPDVSTLASRSYVDSAVASVTTGGSTSTIVGAGGRGINGAGGEFPENLPGVYNSNYRYPSLAEINAWAGYGHRVLRLPFRWERVQPTRNAVLDTTELGRIKTVVAGAHAAGMNVLLDVHNYARYVQGTRTDGVGGTDLVLGQGLPEADLVDLWTRLSDEFATTPGIFGYGLMNEPHDLAPIVGTFTGSSRFTFNDGVQGWIPEGTATASAVGGALRISQVLNAQVGYVRTNSNGQKASAGVTVSETGRTFTADVTVSANVVGYVSGFLSYQRGAPNYEFIQPSDTTFTRVDTGAVVSGLVPGVKTRMTCTYAEAPTGMYALGVQVNYNNAQTGTVTYDVDVVSQGDTVGSVTPAQVWERASQACVDAIRGRGDQQRIVVPGYNYSGVNNWVDHHPTAWITDPADATIYEAHYYADQNNAGFFDLSYAATLAAIQGQGDQSFPARINRQMTPWLNWCVAQGVQGFLGEFGWANTGDTAAWNGQVGEATYALLDAYGVGGTYWAAGAAWGATYVLSAYVGDSQETKRAPATVIEAHLTQTSEVVTPTVAYYTRQQVDDLVAARDQTIAALTSRVAVLEGNSGGSTLTVTDNLDGTGRVSGPAVTDNGDGTGRINHPSVIDNGDGTGRVAA